MKAFEIEESLRASLWWYQDHVDELFDGVKSGEPDAVESLMVTLPNPDRGLGIRWVRALKLGFECQQRALSMGWDHDHDVVRAEAGKLDTLHRWFVGANFNYHRTLPQWMTVWRGTTGVGFARARRGISWTRDRDTACWFATQYRHQGKPLVLKQRVWRADVRFYSNERKEQEVVVFAPGNVKVDGTPEEWFARGEAKVAEMRADLMRRLAPDVAA